MSCIICLSNNATYAFNKCGHKLFCDICSEASKLHQLKNCSLCRTQGDLIKIFNTMIDDTDIDIDTDTDTDTDETSKTELDKIEVKKQNIIQKVYEHMKEQFEDVVKALTTKLDNYNSKINTIRQETENKNKVIFELVNEHYNIEESLNKESVKNEILKNKLKQLEEENNRLDINIKHTETYNINKMLKDGLKQLQKKHNELLQETNDITKINREIDITLRKLKRKQEIKKKQIIDIVLKQYGYIINNGKLGSRL
jgi:chromosome segregation ATPase